MSDRLYPARPLLAASVAVFRSGRVLLARRVAPPAAGLFALPGGLVETGETMAQAALRELHEETGVKAQLIGFNAHNEVIERAGDGRVSRHFVVASFAARWISGEGQTGPEAAEIIWARRGEAQKLDLVAGLDAILQNAWRMAEAAP